MVSQQRKRELGTKKGFQASFKTRDEDREERGKVEENEKQVGRGKRSEERKRGESPKLSGCRLGERPRIYGKDGGELLGPGLQCLAGLRNRSVQFGIKSEWQ